MTYPTHDTNWATSAKGNDWRRLKGKVLVVGKKKTGGYWSRVDGTFLPGEFKTQRAAMNAATDAAMPNVFDDWNLE